MRYNDFVFATILLNVLVEPLYSLERQFFSICLDDKSQIQLRRLRASDLVIIDDIMYMALDKKEATLFFQLIHQLYEPSSIILTSNSSPEEWTELVDNQGMMTAILDRLLHRVEIIHMDV